MTKGPPLTCTDYKRSQKPSVCYGRRERVRFDSIVVGRYLQVSVRDILDEW